MSDKHLHMTLIQRVVTRLAHNSFLLKGWSVILVSALFALAAGESRTAESKTGFLFLACLPAAVFWILDGYFLYQERLFRRLYDHVRVKEEGDIDFSMDTSIILADCPGWFETVFSKTLVIFYGSIVLISVILVTILSFQAL